MTPEYEFMRKITKQRLLDDGCEEITLECGHMAIAVGGAFKDSMYCSQCVDDFLTEARAGSP